MPNNRPSIRFNKLIRETKKMNQKKLMKTEESPKK